MEKIPTAEELFEKRNPQDGTLPPWAKTLMIEFAKLHTQAALKAASEKARVSFEKRTRTYTAINKRFVVNGGDVYTIDKHTILKSYPVENII
jgi:RecA-family ATPase